jgi:hypothetical protein
MDRPTRTVLASGCGTTTSFTESSGILPELSVVQNATKPRFVTFRWCWIGGILPPGGSQCGWVAVGVG